MSLPARPQESCPAEEAMEIFGGKWCVGIVHHLKEEPLRFNELRHRLPGVTQKMLTQQLRHLRRYGIIERRQFEEIPPRVEYSLTAMGRTLFPLLDHISQWSLANMSHIRQAVADYDSEVGET